MTTSFKDLKRSSTNSIDKLNQELAKFNTPKNGKDERVWSCQTDKSGNGMATIRFLPAPGGEDVPFIRLFTHGFKGPTGSWYIENSLTTIGQQDPIAELNTKLWNSGIDSDKETVRKQKRQLNYYSNIYVVKDPANPANEGKVFLFRYGKKIFDQLNDKMNPQFEDEKSINPFDLWEGANFKLKIRKVEGYANYDKSEFEAAGPLSDDDEALEKIWKSEYSLQELLLPKNFKSYDELQKQLNRALGLTGAAAPRKQIDEDDTPPFKMEEPKFKAKEAPEAPAASASGDDDDLDMAFFNTLDDD